MKNALSSLKLSILDVQYNFRVRLGNRIRWIFTREIDYIVINLKGGLPEFTPPSPWWHRYLPLLRIPVPETPLSLTELREILERIADDPRPKGIVVQLDDLDASWAGVQSLRTALTRFKKSGKKVLAYCGREIDPSTYLAACAADQIVAPPSVHWNVIGLRMGVLFFREALARLGIKVEVIAVSPYKSSGDIFSRKDMSEEQQENLTWILDIYYNEIIKVIADSRALDEEEVRNLIDCAPILASDAKDAKLLDEVLYFDEIARFLSDKTDENDVKIPLDLKNIEQLSSVLLRPTRKRSGKAIGVVSLRGLIIPGESQRTPLPIPLPIVGSEQVGSNSIARLLRRLEENNSIAGIVFHVESSGGSSLASDLIWRELDRISKKKPVVVYMGSVAASGGYYVSTPADWIVAQSLTLTGSIGVLFIKPVTQELFEKIHINRVSLERGTHADLFSDDVAFEEHQRDFMEKHVDRIYDLFKERVVQGRQDQLVKSGVGLDEIAGGRVWMGAQALNNGLIDEIGDFEVAVKKVKALANISSEKWTPTIWAFDGGEHQLSYPYPVAQPDGDRFRKWWDKINRSNYWMVLPFEINIKH